MAKRKNATLKEMYTKRTEMLAEMTKHKEAVRKAQDRINTLCGEFNELEEQIKQETSNLVVTEHAMLRYLERTGRIDMQKLKDEILPEHVLAQAQQLGSGRYPIGHGLRAVVKDNKVVTVEPV